jgi:two-component system, cell cycle sensor histidine kinase and response regulator CckA
MAEPHTGKERRDIIIVTTITLLFPLFSMYIRLSERLYDFSTDYKLLGITEYLINFCFLYLLGLLYLTYRNWLKTEKKRKELKNIIDSINPDVLIVVDQQRKVVVCNNTIQRMFGYHADEAIQQTTDLLYFDRRSYPEEKKHEIYESLEKEGFHIGLATGKKKSGETFPLEIITGSLSGEQGAVLLLRDITTRKEAENALLQVRNELEIRVRERTEELTLQSIMLSDEIAERKQSEEALRESEARFRHLLQSVQNVAVQGYGPEGTTRYWNQATERLYGYTAQEAIGRNLLDLIIPQEMRGDVEKAIQQMAETGQPIPASELSLMRKDGSRVAVFSSHAIVKLPGREPELFCIDIDLTERKQVEEEKRRLEEHLQRAEKMEAIGTLAGGIAHDFNNLLMGIQGYASLTLMDLHPSHPHYERLKRIEEQVQSGADLTKQLLGFARGGRYDAKPADMNDIINKSSSMFGRTKKEISINRQYGKDLWAVEADLGQMEQVFMNLYVNAWQAMPGGGEIYLETENVLLSDEQAISYSVRPGKYVKISVTDTGTGMDEKTRERIFDPFFTTKGMGRGTGLGLATVYGIVKGHKGAINVYSEPGHGTTFNIYLPASEKEVVKEKTATGAIARGAETILLVDDEKMILEVSREMLEYLGYRVYAAGSGQEALAVYMEKRNEIDLVILDMIMPGISGGETFDRIREINSEIRVLLSSGYSINGEAKTIMDRGCNGFIQKPFQLEKLSQKVRDMIV